MRRRELLKAIPALALAPLLKVNGEDKSVGTAIPPGHYMIFADPHSVNFDTLLDGDMPAGVSIECVPVQLSGGRTIQDVVAIYKLDTEKEPLVHWPRAGSAVDFSK